MAPGRVCLHGGDWIAKAPLLGTISGLGRRKGPGPQLGFASSKTGIRCVPGGNAGVKVSLLPPPNSSPMTNAMIISTTGNAKCAAVEMQAPAFADMETAKAIIVAESSRLCAAAVDHSARAIVLTGSMSRGEATLKRDDAGWRVLGDATFLL